MREAEDRETKEGEHTCLWRENLKNSFENLLYNENKGGVEGKNRQFTDHT